MKRLIIAVATLTLSSPVLAEPKNLDGLLARCGEKTVVYGRGAKGEIEEVGKRIDGYCAYLHGSFAALVKAKIICQKKMDDDVSPEFLLSIVQNYREKAGSGAGDAASGVEAAFMRTFSRGR